MEKCPICSHKLKIARIEDPSPEQRNEIDNFYGGTAPTDYYLYKSDTDRRLVQDENFQKQKKNFPGNKKTFVQLETPEDAPTIAGLKKKADYRDCDEKLIIGHYIIADGLFGKIVNWKETREGVWVDVIYMEDDKARYTYDDGDDGMYNIFNSPDEFQVLSKDDILISVVKNEYNPQGMVKAFFESKEFNDYDITNMSLEDNPDFTEQDFKDKAWEELEADHTIKTQAFAKDDFLYAECTNCGHKVIHMGEKPAKAPAWEVKSYEYLRDDDGEIIYDDGDKGEDPAVLITVIENHLVGEDGPDVISKEVSYIYPQSDLEGLTTKNVEEFVKKKPTPVQRIIDRFMNETSKYTSADDWEMELNSELENDGDITELWLEKNELYDLTEEAVKKAWDDDVKRVIEKAKEDYRPDYEDPPGDMDYFEWTFYLPDWFTYDDQKDLIEGGWSWEKFAKWGEEQIDSEMSENHYRGSWDVELGDIFGKNYHSSEDTRQLEKIYVKEAIKTAKYYGGGEYGNEAARLLMTEIVSKLNSDDSDFTYIDDQGIEYPAYPDADHKNFILGMIAEGLEPEITEEEANKIPIKSEVTQATTALLKSTDFAIYREARQPDIKQDDVLDHENLPIDKNQPANQSKIMGDDFNKLESATEEEDVVKRYRKNKQGLNYAVPV